LFYSKSKPTSKHGVFGARPCAFTAHSWSTCTYSFSFEKSKAETLVSFTTQHWESEKSIQLEMNQILCLASRTFLFNGSFFLFFLKYKINFHFEIQWKNRRLMGVFHGESIQMGSQYVKNSVWQTERLKIVSFFRTAPQKFGVYFLLFFHVFFVFLFIILVNLIESSKALRKRNKQNFKK